MKDKYFSNLITILSTSNDDEWWKRTTKCAKHLLTGICFRESSKMVSTKTGNAIFPPIGFYYSLFHVGVAMLFMEHCTSISELKHLRHNKLRNLIQKNLIEQNLLDSSYLKLLIKLTTLREYANYSFGERYVKYDYKNMIDDLYHQTGNELDLAIKFILEVENNICRVLGFIMPIKTAIGDEFGDDLKRAYLSSDDEEKVNEYLLAKNLTT